MAKIQRFNDFVNEKYSDYFSSTYDRKERKTKFSNWLEDVKGRLKDENRELAAKTSGSGGAGRGSAGAKALFNVLLGGIGGTVATTVDFLFGKNDSAENKEGMDKKKKLDAQLPETVTQKEAEKFYRDCLLAGKDKFGPSFDLEKPKTKEQKRYAKFVEETMERLYKKIK